MRPTRQPPDAAAPAVRAAAGPGVELTAEDLVVLRLLATGWGGVGMAREMGYSEATMRRRVQAVRRRLGVATTVEAVASAVRAGLV